MTLLAFQGGSFGLGLVLTIFLVIPNFLGMRNWYRRGLAPAIFSIAHRDRQPRRFWMLTVLYWLFLSYVAAAGIYFICRSFAK